MPERIFLEDRGERYPKGKIANYPLSTWKSFFPGFETFTSPVEDVAAEAVTAAPPPPKRGRPKREISDVH